jgi:hypothetical protein
MGQPFGDNAEDGFTELLKGTVYREYLDKLSSKQLVVVRLFLMVLTVGVVARCANDSSEILDFGVALLLERYGNVAAL